MGWDKGMDDKSHLLFYVVCNYSCAFNQTTTEVRECMTNYIPLLNLDVITCPCPN